MFVALVLFAMTALLVAAGELSERSECHMVNFPRAQVPYRNLHRRQPELRVGEDVRTEQKLGDFFLNYKFKVGIYNIYFFSLRVLAIYHSLLF